MIEAIGYLASALIILSLTSTRILRLRVMSLLGSSTFLLYGFLIASIPIMVTNAVIIVINVVFLWRATRVKEWFSLLEVRPDSLYLEEFLRFHHDDIVTSQPDWDGTVGDADVAALILRDMLPAMAIVGSTDDGTLHLRLDYAIPRFRDYRMGRFLYDSNPEFFADKGVHTIEANARTKMHARYLAKMGFTESEPGRYQRSIT